MTAQQHEFASRSGVGTVKVRPPMAWTPDLIKTAISMAGGGYGPTKIAAHFGIGVPAVSKLLSRHKIHRQVPGGVAVGWAEIERHNAGEHNPAVAARFAGIMRGFQWTPALIGKMGEMRADLAGSAKIQEVVGANKFSQQHAVQQYGMPMLPKKARPEAPARKMSETVLNEKFWADTGRDVPAQRVCISRRAPRCLQVFASTGASNRICSRCRTMAAGGMD